jgi:hypothetical protein
MLKYILVFMAATTICFGQVDGRDELQKCELLFKDGTTFEGYGKIIEKDKIEFSIEPKGETDIWDHKDVKLIKFYAYETRVLEYFNTKVGDKHKLLEVLVDGDVTLYVDAKEGLIPKMNLELKVSLKKRKYKLYYLKKAPSEEIKFVNTSMGSKWKKKMLEYFKDCPLIIEGIKSRQYIRTSMRSMVEDYNLYCVE